MSDFDFEARLERLYATPPRLSDGEAFARRVEDRLDREWSLRRGLILVAGVAGAGVAVSQTLGSELYQRLQAMADPVLRVAAGGLSGVAPGELLAQPMLWTGEAMWTMAAVAGLIAAFTATRWADAL
jgi:hypothetical protein